MAQFITLPQYQNPWVQNLPSMLQQMTLQKVAQRFRREEDEKERQFQTGQTQDQRSYQQGVLQEKRQYEAGLLREKRDYELETTPEWVKTPSEHVRAGAKTARDSKGDWYVYTPKKSNTGKWEQLRPIQYGGALIYPQRNTETNEVKYNRFPPKPKGVGGVGGTGGKGTVETSRKIQAVQDHLNEIRTKYKLGKVDIMAMISLPSEERKKWYAEQTKPILDRIPNRKDRIAYQQRLKQLDALVSESAGPAPAVEGTGQDADYYLRQAGGDIVKAKQMALADGIILE